MLERLHIPFVVAAPNVNETAAPGESARHTALRLAECKARALSLTYPDAVIIGSDQVAVLDGEHLGKPGGHDAALAQLQRMRGQVVAFHTALCVLNARSGRLQRDDIVTTVRFRNYSDEQATRYLAIDEPYDCAGSAKIEGLGIALVDRVESDDPTALVGLPLIALTTMLQKLGIPLL